jgi:hypothetical protein
MTDFFFLVMHACFQSKFVGAPTNFSRPLLKQEQTLSDADFRSM